MNEFIKNETAKRINEFKEKAREKGLPITERDEAYLRIGVGYGISIAGLALVNVDISKLV